MRKILIPLFALAASLATTAPAHAAGEVNLYSYRQPFLISRCSTSSRSRPASR